MGVDPRFSAMKNRNTTGSHKASYSKSTGQKRKKSNINKPTDPVKSKKAKFSHAEKTSLVKIYNESIAPNNDMRVDWNAIAHTFNSQMPNSYSTLQLKNLYNSIKKNKEPASTSSTQGLSGEMVQTNIFPVAISQTTIAPISQLTINNITTVEQAKLPQSLFVPSSYSFDEINGQELPVSEKSQDWTQPEVDILFNVCLKKRNNYQKNDFTSGLNFKSLTSSYIIECKKILLDCARKNLTKPALYSRDQTQIENKVKHFRKKLKKNTTA